MNCQLCILTVNRSLQPSPPLKNRLSRLHAEKSMAREAKIPTQLPQYTDVLVCGAGIAGTALAVVLSRRESPAGRMKEEEKEEEEGGHVDFQLVEAADGIREGGTAISFWTNAWKALETFGLPDSTSVASKLREECWEASRLFLETAGEKVITEVPFEECSGGPHEFRSVQRSHLLSLLTDAVQSDGVGKGGDRRIHFGKRVEEIREIPLEQQKAQGEGGDLDAPFRYQVKFSDGSSILCRVVVGADGIGSAVRKFVCEGGGKGGSGRDLVRAGYAAFRGIARLPERSLRGSSPFSVPSSLDERGRITQILGEGVRMGVVRMDAERVYWFVAFNSPPLMSPSGRRQGTGKETDGDALRKRCKELLQEKGWRSDALALVDSTPSDCLFLSDISFRPPALAPWGVGGVSLIGDAAHPTTPNLAQGGAAGLEDAVELGRVLRQKFGERQRSPDVSSSPRISVEELLREWERGRIPRLVQLNVRAFVLGAVLQLDLGPLTSLRDFLMSTFLASSSPLGIPG
eukprot:Cvel_29612.t1-p1 / transcript=Cvel_29612.t1 / gene=Cvel_29612 / organism=Chromera_velia_CCMP2878 / gene_product=FAD-dependent urate hydroxylase, putative / transcript_product=FAD-dependent urate hydroxylase, putative / location=Cvel_scaffold4082:5021-7951(+) / protein_length=516 / sequence_SO=supercontig / SO=protein_coding / is_pseudo=false